MGRRVLRGNTVRSYPKDIQAFVHAYTHFSCLVCFIALQKKKRIYFFPLHLVNKNHNFPGWNPQWILCLSCKHVSSSNHPSAADSSTSLWFGLDWVRLSHKRASMKASTPTSNALKRVIKIVQQRRWGYMLVERCTDPYTSSNIHKLTWFISL